MISVSGCGLPLGIILSLPLAPVRLRAILDWNTAPVGEAAIFNIYTKVCDFLSNVIFRDHHDDDAL